MNPYVMVTDGACSKNPGPGGWGLILVTPKGQVKEFGGYEDNTTNNRMELMGFLEGLREVFKLAKVSQESRTLRVICDSKYVLDGAEKSVRNWARREWVTSTGSEVKNQDLWERILKGLDQFSKLGFKIEYVLVKGHSGHEGNERADQIAVKFSRQEPIDLYDGPQAKYPIAITVPTAEDVAAAKSFEPFYLSYVGGVLSRHTTWPECQKAVEGKSGAKYKKIKNALEERDTLKTWGVT